ncbi:mitochondrial import protein 1 [Diplodia corticola]|uniref:Mitochondrial import protein 1 n=1 Tax=Diplodia corticola TaxID=236234 RepID=A0A1J9RZY6_9PEZI|nr:mitochondrial import protein 1 [Diplodia corticola]OJD33005.1 mitochondrial import protein 1 [Diplodia corticola]
MASPAPERNVMSESVTIPSDSENYDGNNELSSSPASSSSSPVILYTPPTFWGLMRGAAINLVLPFINGLMLGFGELFAHEVAFRLGWSGTKIFPTHRSSTRRVGPGVQMQSDPVRRRRRSGEEMDMYAALE